MDTNEKCSQLPILHTQIVEWAGGEKNGDTINMPHPIYSSEVKEWIKTFYELELADHNYRENYRSIADKELSDLSRDEILTKMTFIIRGERFCDGMIAEALKDGSLEKLCVRLHETTSK